MLWINVRIGESVLIGDSVLTLLAKNAHSVAISLDGEQHTIPKNTRTEFPTFTLLPGSLSHGLRLGFDAPLTTRIRREKLEA